MMMALSTEALNGIAGQIRSGRLDEARAALKAVPETPENEADRIFLRGFLQEMSYDRKEALATYEKALEANPDHMEAAFRAALIADQYGDDDWATELYARCTERPEAPVHALLNLAVLEEERGELPAAEACLLNVLDVFPTHHRAGFFLKSVESSYSMVYDEHTQKEREKRDALLDQPISDFELSVRSRNCLRQMNLRTLGDLLRTTEPELLSYKNFGETSLNEIKALLTTKGLRLGQAVQPPEPFKLRPPLPVVSDEASSSLNRPVAELELSVRSRKALQRLGVTTLGELAQRSEAELLTIKNFGQTSLNEIKNQLTKYGLSLRTPGA
jgi:DNA-directed RNA polymerase subunit alpha